jgi:hypothetical protein
MLAADAEGLARRSTRDERHVSAMLEEVVVPNITLHDLPVADVLDAVVTVAAKGTASVVVPLDDDLVAQPGLGGPEGQPTRPGEQFHAFHESIARLPGGFDEQTPIAWRTSW